MSPAAYQGQQQANGIPKPFNSKTAPVATQRKDGTPGRRKEGGFVEELYTTKLDPEKLSEEQKRRAEKLAAEIEEERYRKAAGRGRSARGEYEDEEPPSPNVGGVDVGPPASTSSSFPALSEPRAQDAVPSFPPSNGTGSGKPQEGNTQAASIVGQAQQDSAIINFALSNGQQEGKANKGTDSAGPIRQDEDHVSKQISLGALQNSNQNSGIASVVQGISGAVQGMHPMDRNPGNMPGNQHSMGQNASMHPIPIAPEVILMYLSQPENSALHAFIAQDHQTKMSMRQEIFTLQDRLKDSERVRESMENTIKTLELEKASWHREKALLEQKQNEKSLNTGGVNPDEMLLKRVEAEFEMLKLEKARMQEALRVAEERELQLFQQLEQEKMLSRMVMHPQQAHFLQMFRQREQMAQMGMPANVQMNESMMHGRMEESGGVGMGMPPPNRGPVVDMNNVMMNPYLQQMQMQQMHQQMQSMNNMQGHDMQHMQHMQQPSQPQPQASQPSAPVPNQGGVQPQAAAPQIIPNKQLPQDVDPSITFSVPGVGMARSGVPQAPIPSTYEVPSSEGTWQGDGNGKPAVRPTGAPLADPQMDMKSGNINNQDAGASARALQGTMVNNQNSKAMAKAPADSDAMLQQRKRELLSLKKSLGHQEYFDLENMSVAQLENAIKRLQESVGNKKGAQRTSTNDNVARPGDDWEVVHTTKKKEAPSIVDEKLVKTFNVSDKLNVINGNLLRGLALYHNVIDQKYESFLVNFINEQLARGKRKELKGATYVPAHKGSKRGAQLHYGIFCNYADNSAGGKDVEPLPEVLLDLSSTLITEGIIPPNLKPNTAVVNVYEEGDQLQPHVDSKDFLRPICTISLLSEADVVFGDNGGRIELHPNGQLDGYSFQLPRRSVLLADDVAANDVQHAIAPLKSRRMSVTFRRHPQLR